MCNVAQIVNVLDAMLLTQGDQCIRTPSYYAFLLAKPHRGKMSVRTDPPQSNPLELSVSASFRNNLLAITLINPKLDVPVRVRCHIRDTKLQKASAQSLFHADLNAVNSFEQPNKVVPTSLKTDIRPEGLLLTLPPLSVTTVQCESA